ncbi:uncharacterized protein BBA_10028 [Beauveria bassiana ARSEF 2860]|uniref:Uncharacterized protein n=1 Tax=Beauveria bassiana (strain ARSEF 2860) TaxID=655819 RepID=J4KKT5_BEAB2|nr:uncharacterized protein BBA_10028 [Beauveria bassiana ARSEF 2860]EJP61014.1 hypothetical protein BBA_10028 [Beauveria bassiana ARSEF 2860]
MLDDKVVTHHANTNDAKKVVRSGPMSATSLTKLKNSYSYERNYLNVPHIHNDVAESMPPLCGIVEY